MASITRPADDMTGGTVPSRAASQVIHDVGGAGPIYSAATGPDGRRYFSDEFHHRVVIEESTGYHWSFGQMGGGAGEFRHPRGLALLASETIEACRLFVCDAWNHRIQVFDGQGVFLFAFGSAGNGEGQFDVPSDITLIRPEFPGEDLGTDPHDGTWLAVADRWNNRVQVFDFDGAFIATTGGRLRSTTASHGALGATGGWPFFRIGVDPTTWFPVRLHWSPPHLEITSANGRILNVDLALAMLPDFERWRQTASMAELAEARRELTSGAGALRSAPEVLAAIDTRLGAAQLADGRASDAARSWAMAWPTGLSPRAVDRQLEQRVVAAEAYLSGPSARVRRRLLLKGLRSRLAIERRRRARETVTLHLQSERSASRARHDAVIGTAVDPAALSSLWAPTARLSALKTRVGVLERRQDPSATICWTAPPVEGDLRHATVAHGQLAVVAARQPAVWVFDADCAPLGRFALPAGTHPRGIAAGPAGGWYVSDVQHDCLLHLDAAGKIVDRWGHHGERPDAFNGPLGLAADAEGLFVADRDNDRVEQYDDRGCALGAYPRLSAPTAVAIDSESLWVAEWRRHAVRRLARATGEILGVLQHPDLVAPVAVALTDELVLVADYCGGVHAFTTAGTWRGCVTMVDGRSFGRLHGLVVIKGYGVAVDHDHGCLLRFRLPQGDQSWQSESR
ncbi:MAG TPA: NHL repeat-containing protein [Vicinamibacterales bacterium]